MAEESLPLIPDYSHALDKILVSLLDNVSINLVTVELLLGGLATLV